MSVGLAYAYGVGHPACLAPVPIDPLRGVPKTVQGATCQVPPGCSSLEDPGREEQSNPPARAARRLFRTGNARVIGTAQTPAPDAAYAAWGRGGQEGKECGAAGLLECCQGGNKNTAEADDRSDEPAQINDLTGSNFGKTVGNLLSNLSALFFHLGLKRILHAVDFLIKRVLHAVDFLIKRVLHAVDLLIKRILHAVDLLINGPDLRLKRLFHQIDLRIQRLHILVNKLDLASQTFLDPFKVALGRRSFGVPGTYGAGDGFGLRLFKPHIPKALGFRDGIVGRVCHDHSLAGVPFCINPLRGLCQCLRVSAATLVATLCLAQAAQAQTTDQSPAFNPPPAAGTSEALLDGFERRLMQTRGQLITLNLSGTSEYGVFYAPFSILWLLEGTTGAVRGAGRVTRTRDHLYLTRDEITLLAGPEMPTPIDAHAPGTDAPQHPIASFHDRLLSQPLAEPLADLPAGSRFETEASGEPGGTVTLPGAGDTEAIPARALWRSLGDHIVITRGDGRSETLHWRAVDAALKGNAG